MLFWVMMALLTVAATLVVVRPLIGPAAADLSREGQDAAIYRDQLSELDRDRQRGLIGAAEAGAARTEIARRLLAAHERGAPSASRRPIAGPTVVIVVAFIPALVLTTYLFLGNPGLADAPLAARLTEAPAETDVDAMVARVERHLETHPEDVDGWRVLAPIYMRSDRFEAAADAYGRVVAAGAADADTQEAYGIALVAAAGGVVSAKAQGVFADVVKAAPDRPSARFYLAEALRQAGDAKAALVEIDAAIARSPADAPWLETVRGKRAELLGQLKLPADTPEPATLPAVNPAPGPTAADVQAAGGMSAGDRATMIGGMVQQLAERLAASPHDKDGWLRLMRSYMVLGQPDKASAALGSARQAFKDDAAALAEFDAAANQLGMSGK